MIFCSKNILRLLFFKLNFKIQLFLTKPKLMHFEATKLHEEAWHFTKLRHPVCEFSKWTNCANNWKIHDQHWISCAQNWQISVQYYTDCAQTVQSLYTDCVQPASQETPPSPHVKSGGDCPLLRASPTLSHHYGEVTIRVSSDWPSVEHWHCDL